MNESVAEVIILTANSLGAGILLFIAGVVQPMMDDMDESAFRQFLNRMVRGAMTNHLVVTVGTLPLIAAVLYFVAYRFNHWWFTAGLVVWLIGSTMTKITNMPVYNWVGDPSYSGGAELRRQRRKLRLGNHLRAWLTLASVILMACQFGARVVGIVVAVSAVISFPLVWLARKYMPS
jgi:hypothetical protein